MRYVTYFHFNKRKSRRVFGQPDVLDRANLAEGFFNLQPSSLVAQASHPDFAGGIPLVVDGRVTAAGQAAAPAAQKPASRPSEASATRHFQQQPTRSEILILPDVMHARDGVLRRAIRWLIHSVSVNLKSVRNSISRTYTSMLFPDSVGDASMPSSMLQLEEL